MTSKNVLPTVFKQEMYRCAFVVPFVGTSLSRSVPNGKSHLKFPLWLFEPLPKIVHVLQKSAYSLARAVVL